MGRTRRIKKKRRRRRECRKKWYREEGKKEMEWEGRKGKTKEGRREGGERRAERYTDYISYLAFSSYKNHCFAYHSKVEWAAKGKGKDGGVRGKGGKREGG